MTFSNFLKRERMEEVGWARSKIVTEESLYLVGMGLVNYICDGIELGFHGVHKVLCFVSS